MNKLPQAIREDKLILFGVELRVYILDDGRRVIDADDTHRLFAKMKSDSDNENSC
jgi:hypothetical protein